MENNVEKFASDFKTLQTLASHITVTKSSYEKEPSPENEKRLREANKELSNLQSKIIKKLIDLRVEANSVSDTIALVYKALSKNQKDAEEKASKISERISDVDNEGILGDIDGDLKTEK